MNTPSPILFTQAGYQKLKEEQLELQSKRKEAVSQLSRAREMGDLSENGFYKAARANLSSIDHRLRQLTYQIRYGKVSENVNKYIVAIGSAVTIDDGKQQKAYQIVGGYESDPLNGKLSHISPIGKALVGKKVGEIINVAVPSGMVVYKIVTIT